MKIKFTSALCLLLLAGTAFAQENYKVVKTFHIASAGGWDYISVNNGKIYCSHGGQVNILDEKTGDSVGVVPNTTGVHGIAFDNELNRGYTSNGRLNNVTVFDLKTNEIITQIATGENPDAIMFEPFSKKIITNNGRSKNLTVIDPVTNKVVSTIDVGGKPEEATSDGAGKLYVNDEDHSMIVEVDMKTYSVLNHWPLAPGTSPSGLAIDTKNHRLFSACGDSKLMVVMDATNGKIIDKQPIGDGCDGLSYDKSKGLIFTSNGEGNITVIKQISANEYKVIATVPTKRSARTMAIDQATHTLFLPAADFEAPAVGSQNRRGTMIPGTFQVLVVQ